MQQRVGLCAAICLQARCKYSDQMVAIKVYKLKEQGDIQRMQLYREIKLHSKLQHNNVIQYLACFLVSAAGVRGMEGGGGHMQSKHGCALGDDACTQPLLTCIYGRMPP